MPIAEQPVASLYSANLTWLHGLLRRQLGCSETAADLAQDVFLRLLARGEDVRQVEQPRAYLRHIAHGLLANHWRRRDIERAYLDALAARPEAEAPSPETHHLIIETLCRVDAWLQGLPAKVRRAFLLSRLDGLGYAAIGDRLGVSERMVKKYMAQAMLHLLHLAEDRP